MNSGENSLGSRKPSVKNDLGASGSQRGVVFVLAAPKGLQSAAASVIGSGPCSDQREGALCLEEVSPSGFPDFMVISKQTEQIVYQLKSDARVPSHPFKGRNSSSICPGEDGSAHEWSHKAKACSLEVCHLENLRQPHFRKRGLREREIERLAGRRLPADCKQVPHRCGGADKSGLQHCFDGACEEVIADDHGEVITKFSTSECQVKGRTSSAQECPICDVIVNEQERMKKLKRCSEANELRGRRKLASHQAVPSQEQSGSHPLGRSQRILMHLLTHGGPAQVVRNVVWRLEQLPERPIDVPSHAPHHTGGGGRFQRIRHLRDLHRDLLNAFSELFNLCIGLPLASFWDERPSMKQSWIHGVVALSASMVFAAEPGGRRSELLDAFLVSSSGAATRLLTQFGMPTVLFYEDRYSTLLNQRTKEELFARGKRDGLLRAARVVAVANLEGYDWFPARNFALAAVRDAEKKAGVPVLVDWSGALSAPPWNLPAKTSSVLLFDAAGRVVFERSGQLSEHDQAALFQNLRDLIDATPMHQEVTSPATP